MAPVVAVTVGVSYGPPVDGHVSSELISDDPRKEIPHACEIRELCEAFEKHGQLVTTGQAARILDRSTGQLGAWLNRGRFTRIDSLGAVLLPLAEVMAYKRLRDSGADLSGGRGRRVPSKEDLRRAS